MERLRNLNAGLGQYCLHLGRALTKMSATQDIHLAYYLPESKTGLFGASEEYKQVSKWHKTSRVNVVADLWHCMHQDSEYYPKRKDMPVVLTIHDLNFLERADYSRWRKFVKLQRLQRKINRMKGLVYISSYVKSVVHGHLEIPGTVMETVIYNGVAVENQTEMTKPKTKTPYLFSIGLHPKKNYAAALVLLKYNPDLQWIIAGEDSKDYMTILQKKALELGVSDRLSFTGLVEESEKWTLYQNCTAFIFPSLSEGFGLPVLEAMSYGKPVFLSIKTSLPEIGGKEAYYFQNFEAEHICEVFEKGMQEFNNDSTKSERLKQYAAGFQWERAAKEYCAFYHEVLNNNSQKLVN